MNVFLSKRIAFIAFIFSLSYGLSAQVENEKPLITLDAYDVSDYKNLDIVQIIDGLNKELNSGKILSEETFMFLIYDGHSGYSGSFLRNELLPYLVEISNFEKRKDHVQFLSRLFSEVEKFVIDLESSETKLLNLFESLEPMPNDLAELLNYFKTEYEEVENSFIELTNSYIIKGFPRKKFHENGNVSQEIFYNNNGQAVRIDEYYSDGTTSKQILYSRPNGSVALNIEEYHENGKIKKQGSYLNSKKHGKFFEYDQETGKILVEENYVNNKKEGTFKKFKNGGAYLHHEIEFENDIRLKDVTYRPNESKEKTTTYNSNGTILAVEAFGKNNIRTTLSDYRAQTVKKYDPVTGDIVLTASFDANNRFLKAGEMVVANEVLRGQLMLLLSFSSDLSYKEISSLGDTEVADQAMLSILEAILVKPEGSQEYNLALSLIVMPMILDFIEANAKDRDVLAAVEIFAPVADSYNQSRYVTKSASIPSIINIKFTEVERSRMLDMYRSINKTNKVIRGK